MELSERIATVLASEGQALLFDERWFTWAELRRGADLVRQTLDAGGGPTEAPVLIVLRNRPAGVAAFLGLIASGRTVVQVSPIQPPAAIAAAVTRLRPAAIVADRDDWTPELQAAARNGGSVGIEVFIAGSALAAAAIEGLERAGPGPFYADESDAGVVVPTSGTTGPPKLVPLTRGNLRRYMPRDLAPARKTTRTLIIAAPLVTVTGLNPFLSWAARPFRLALMERLDVRRWAALVREFKPREGGLPPAAMRMLLDADVPRDSLASLNGWYTGAAPVDAATAAEFEAEFGIPVLIAYGATEFGGGAVARMTPEDRAAFGDAKRGSAGRAVDDVELRIVDPDSGATMPPGERGLLHVNCPRAVTRDADGWTATNDLARLDEDGFLWIDGRADDVIIRGGFKVPLFEVEGAMLTHPDMVEAAATSVPDARLGQVPVLFYVAARPISDEELDRWARERLAPYKVPVRYVAVPKLPKTATMKISRPALKQLVTDHVVPDQRDTSDSRSS